MSGYADARSLIVTFQRGLFNQIIFEMALHELQSQNQEVLAFTGASQNKTRSNI